MSSENEAARSYSKFSSMVQGKWFQILLSKATVKPGGHCLDVGCGTGNVTAIVAKKIGTNGQVVGIDSNKHRIRIAQKNNSYKNLKFLEGTLFDIDLKESLFDLVFCNIVYHWLSEDDLIKTTAKVFSLLKHNGLFLLSIPIHQMENIKLMLPYCSRETQQRMQSVIRYRPDQYYNDLFTSSDFEIVSFEAEVIETKFGSVHSYLEWADANYETNEELRKVYYQNENKIKFPNDVDRSICDKSTILFIVLRKP